MSESSEVAQPGNPADVVSARVHAADLRARLARAEHIDEAAAASCEALAASPPLAPAVYLAEHGLLRCRGQRGRWQVPDGLPLDAGPMSDTYRTGRPLDAVDVREPVQLGAEQALAGHRSRSTRALRAGPTVVGVLDVVSPEPIDVAERALATAVADELTAWLTAHWQIESPTPLERLARAGPSLAEVHSAAEVEARLVRLACDASGFEGAVLLTPDASGSLVAGPRHGQLSDLLDDSVLAELAAFHRSSGAVSSICTSDGARGPAPDVGRRLASAGVRSLVVTSAARPAGPPALLVVLDRRPLSVRAGVIEALELLALLGATALANARLHAELVDRAATDPLTGLGNHRAFHEAVRDAEGRGRAWSVVMADLDRFKMVNDEHGHLVGDRLLRGVADALRASLDGSEQPFRIGGDELAVVLATADEAAAQDTARRIREAADPVLEPLGAGISTGVAAPRPGDTTEDVLVRADRRLYEAKWAASGRPRRRAADRPA